MVIFRFQEHQLVTQEGATGPGFSFLKCKLLPASRRGGQAFLGLIGSSDTAKIQQYFSVYLLFIQLLITVFEYGAF